MNKLSQFWFKPADSRSYTALRVGYAVASLAQLLTLLPYRHQFFSAAGMINGADLGPAGFLPPVFSLCPSSAGVTAAFLFFLASMVCLGAGILPRAAAVIVYYWHYSLAFDLGVAISGYDMVLKLLGFILMISPLGDRWREKPKQVPAYGLYLIRWQLVCIYLSTVWLKVPNIYWRNGQFTSYFMMSLYSLFPYRAFAHAEDLSVVLTYSTLAIELAIPFLFFIGPLRWLALGLGLLLHVGIAVTSNLWLFSLSMLILYPAFATGADFDRLRKKFR